MPCDSAPCRDGRGAVSSAIGLVPTSPVVAQQLLLHFPLDGSSQAYGPAAGDAKVYVAAGSGNVPRLSVYGDRANFVAARSSAMFGSGMPRDEWVFVAGVVDVASARLALHQGKGRQDRAGINTSNLYPPSNYRNPDDPSLPATTDPKALPGDHFDPKVPPGG